MAEVIKLGQRPRKPTPLAVLEETLAILKRRGWKEVGFADIAAGRTSFWLAEAEQWPISLNNALVLACRNVYGHPQVPSKFQFRTEIDAALDETVGQKHYRWAVAAGRTQEELLDVIERTIERLKAQSPTRRPVQRRRTGAGWEITKANVIKRLYASPASDAISFEGTPIGTLSNSQDYEFINGSQVLVRLYTATLPNFYGQQVVREGCTHAQLVDRLAIAITGILRAAAGDDQPVGGAADSQAASS
ncbi:hypothetical protein J2847_005813 [Azospirillum agricola]|uniref:DUF6197 family protein n=1 Tax=Azospirillum agricola TaxID=1720247 RepID=UPI001AE2970E|nr:hypothetical protein [Azospirillum agricola]MBP2232484.1 hypothetical protein [Azospirillum agricola]